MVGKIESGVGMILSRWGVYVGEIANNQRSESGKQFGIWSNSAENGTWNLIRQEGDEWIYVESSSGGGRVSFASQEALTGHGVWRRY